MPAAPLCYTRRIPIANLLRGAWDESFEEFVVASKSGERNQPVGSAHCGGSGRVGCDGDHGKHNKLKHLAVDHRESIWDELA